ncbi:MAG: hypothetical protein Kow0042_04830 [Calditrichia bacterium]
MHEMLGNQYFLARNYAKAAENLEKALAKCDDNKSIRRKLIVCYTQLTKIDKALDHFLSLIKQDIDYIIKIDPIVDDCPCPELVFDMEARLETNSVDQCIALGILWLYCNFEKSLKYFQKAHQLSKENDKIKSVLSILLNYQNKKMNSLSLN